MSCASDLLPELGGVRFFLPLLAFGFQFEDERDIFERGRDVMLGQVFAPGNGKRAEVVHHFDEVHTTNPFAGCEAVKADCICCL